MMDSSPAFFFALSHYCNFAQCPSRGYIFWSSEHGRRTVSQYSDFISTYLAGQSLNCLVKVTVLFLNFQEASTEGHFQNQWDFIGDDTWRGGDHLVFVALHNLSGWEKVKSLCFDGRLGGVGFILLRFRHHGEEGTFGKTLPCPPFLLLMHYANYTVQPRHRLARFLSRTPHWHIATAA
jgi:hypothetical protein